MGHGSRIYKSEYWYMMWLALIFIKRRRCVLSSLALWYLLHLIVVPPVISHRYVTLRTFCHTFDGRTLRLVYGKRCAKHGGHCKIWTWYTVNLSRNLQRISRLFCSISTIIGWNAPLNGGRLPLAALWRLKFCLQSWEVYLRRPGCARKIHTFGVLRSAAISVFCFVSRASRTWFYWLCIAHLLSYGAWKHSWKAVSCR